MKEIQDYCSALHERSNVTPERVHKQLQACLILANVHMSVIVRTLSNNKALSPQKSTCAHLFSAKNDMEGFWNKVLGNDETVIERIVLCMGKENHCIPICGKW